MTIRAVLFDMDGTITRPWFDFARIRAEIGVAEPLLENLLALPSGPQRDRGFEILARYERDAIAASELNDGARETVEWLRANGRPCALITRNSRWSALATIEKHGLAFDVVMTRDDGPPKPRPEPIWTICERLGLPPGDALLVGDYKYDVLAGKKAGTRTALLTNGTKPKYLEEIRPDYVIERLLALKGIPELSAPIISAPRRR
ncbi:MAG: HAD family hydrolase [Planctomycetes bacterium]|nr:HAD family hydrolase [Planctomycetota bacterium]